MSQARHSSARENTSHHKRDETQAMGASMVRWDSLACIGGVCLYVPVCLPLPLLACAIETTNQFHPKPVPYPADLLEECAASESGSESESESESEMVDENDEKDESEEGGEDEDQFTEAVNLKKIKSRVKTPAWHQLRARRDQSS